MASAHDEAPESAQVIDLMEALRASLGKKTAAAKPVVVEPAEAAGARGQGAQGRQTVAAGAAAAKAEEPAAAPARARARK